MPDIVLTTLNAKYAHAALGLRYLMANLGPLRQRARILEFDVNQRPLDVAEAILAENPRIVGLGVYVWNAAEATLLAADLKRIAPDVKLVLGGPEVSHETEQQEIVRWADHVIAGEADLAFAELCERLLAGGRPMSRIIAAAPPMEALLLPYDLYDDGDVKQRVIYVEASRGCPFECEFCLSSLDVPVRNVPTERFLGEMQKLLDRGVRHFKFVDRTFNLNVNIGRSILEFFRQRYQPGLFLHFEMVPDRLPEALRDSIAEFPQGSLQFEVGVQTFNEAVAARISRRQDNARVEENLRWLREQTSVHVHADLVAGLPGEDIDSFAAGFDRLLGLGPQEIQVGILKRLRGAPIARHDQEWEMVYSPHPPYEVLRTRVIDFPTMQRLRRFARYWDVVANSGNFVLTVPLLWKEGSAFRAFLAFSDWIFQQVGRTHALALDRVARMLFQYLGERSGREPQAVADSLWADWQRCGRRERPEFLKPHLPNAAATRERRQRMLRRQERHLD